MAMMITNLHLLSIMHLFLNVAVHEIPLIFAAGLSFTVINKKQIMFLLIIILEYDALSKPI